MTPQEAAWELAELCVLWDGASEDGCIACGAEYIGDSPHPAHFAECPIPVVRLAMIEKLVDADPTPDSRDGKRLLNLTEAQQAFEKLRFGAPPEDAR